MRRIAIGMSRVRTAVLCVGAAAMAGVAVGCTKLPPPTPLSELNAQQMRGYNQFQAHCAECHSDRTNQALEGPSLRGIFKKKYLDSGSPATDGRVMETILYGYGIMPAMGATMSAQQRADLLAYLHTL